MTARDLYSMLPLLILTGAIVLLLLVVSFYRNYRLTVILTASIFACAFISLFITPAVDRPAADSLLSMDGYAQFYIGLFLAGSFAVTLLSYGYFRNRSGNGQEFYILLILATTGASVLASSRNFVPLFLGLEILSVSLYTLIAYLRSFARSIEAGVKYLILAAVSSAFLLFGIALLYAECGTLDFAELYQRLLLNDTPTPLIYTALGLLIVGFGFKLAVVPFHMWVPDVYQGAPSPVTAFIATVSKGAVMSLLVRFFFVIKAHQYSKLMLVFSVISVASMFAGNLLALRQDNVKRILAYSSIAQLGYLLVAFIAGGNFAVEAVAFYLAAYFATTLCAFGVVTLLSGWERDAESIDDYRGLFWRKPWVAAFFTMSLLSLAGIPLTAGFLAKYYAALAGIQADLWILVLVLVINSAISLYYYLRIIAAMYAQPGAQAPAAVSAASFSPAGGAVLAILALLIIAIGIYPTPLIVLISGLFAGRI